MSRNGILRFDLGLFIPALILAIFSLATLFSINIIYFKSQLFFLIISFFAFVFFSNVNPKILSFYNLPIYIFSITILIVVLIVGIESRGAVRWIDVFGVRIQFSEILKPFLAISFSSFLASFKNSSFKHFILSIFLIVPIAFLIFVQPDLGNALIYLIVAALTLIVFGFPFLWFFLGFIFILGFIPIAWNFLHEYQRQRMLTFFNPSSDPLGTSYNAIQSIMAVGSGMFFGKGLGEGTQSGLKFLPERHTDFIFASLSEEFGFLGSFFIILTFAFLLYRIYTITINSNDKFEKIFSTCSFFFLLTQLFINIGMNIGIMPIVGITFPFVSYGGSSVLSNFILLGLLSSISKNLKEKDVLEIK